MGRRASLQMTASKGELDPDLDQRVDLEAYYDSLASAPNSIFHPQGGFSDRGGFQLVSDADILATGNRRRLRRRIVPVTVTAAQITAANGGTAANLVDQDSATAFQTNAVTSIDFVLFEADLGTPQAIEFVDLIAFQSELLGADQAIAVQYFDGAAWQTFADALDVPAAKAIRTVARTRRFALMPGRAAGPVVARQWRVIVLNAVGIGRVTIGGMAMWRETARVSPVRAEELARAADDMEALIITERNVDVFVNQRWVAAVPLPIAAQQVPELDFAGGFDTLIVLHEMLEPARIQRQGSSGEWNLDAVPFTNVPALISQVVFSGDQDEIQELRLQGLAAGDVVHLMLGKYFAGSLKFTSWAALASDMVTALGGLPGLVAGAANFVIEPQAGEAVRIRFAGANGNRAWPLVSAIVENPAVSPHTAIVQEGLLTTGKYWEERTGWPRCGMFVQQRFLLAGFRAAPTSYKFSVNPSYFDFTPVSDPATADRSFGGALDTKEVETIVKVFVGRHLQVYTLSSEWYSPDRALDATKPVGFVRTTPNGIERGVPVTFVDGASLFVQKSGKTLRDFLYNDIEQAYNAEPLSVLSPQLITNCVDLDVRLARDVRDGNIVLMINSDGSAAAVTMLRKQNVIAGAPWRTPHGFFRSVVATSAHVLYCVFERGGDLYLERWVPDVALDWATHVTGSPRTVQTGADYLEGRSDVWVIADGEDAGPVTVTGGAFPLPFPASDVTYGLVPEWRARGQVVREKLAAGQPFRPPGRIFEMELALRSTGNIRLGTYDDDAGVEMHDVPLVRAGGIMRGAGPLQTASGGDPGLAMTERLFTGNVTLQGLLGISTTPHWYLDRVGPAPVHVKAVRYEISYKGD